MILLVRLSLLQPAYMFSYEWEAFLQFIRGHLSFHALSRHYSTSTATTTSVKCITAADSHNNNNNNNKNISFVLLYARPLPALRPAARLPHDRFRFRRVSDGWEKFTDTRIFRVHNNFITVIIVRGRETERRSDTEIRRGNHREAYVRVRKRKTPRGRFIHSPFDFRIFPERFRIDRSVYLLMF